MFDGMFDRSSRLIEFDLRVGNQSMRAGKYQPLSHRYRHAHRPAFGLCYAPLEGSRSGDRYEQPARLYPRANRHAVGDAEIDDNSGGIERDLHVGDQSIPADEYQPVHIHTHTRARARTHAHTRAHTHAFEHVRRHATSTHRHRALRTALAPSRMSAPPSRQAPPRTYLWP